MSRFPQPTSRGSRVGLHDEPKSTSRPGFPPLQSSDFYVDYFPRGAVQMASSSPSRKSTDEVGLEELIFSCSICQATISDVYAHPEGNKGFRSASGEQQEDGIVTRMWIAECSHITCSKHLEGGGK